MRNFMMTLFDIFRFDQFIAFISYHHRMPINGIPLFWIFLPFSVQSKVFAYRITITDKSSCGYFISAKFNSMNGGTEGGIQFMKIKSVKPSKSNAERYTKVHVTGKINQADAHKRILIIHSCDEYVYRKSKACSSNESLTIKLHNSRIAYVRCSENHQS